MIRIEPLAKSHLAAVLSIEQDSFTSAWSPSMFESEVESNALSRSFVMMRDSELVGYVIAWFVRGEVHLLNIAVSHRHRRHGYATQLLYHLYQLAIAEGQEVVTLEVRRSNEPALRLYATQGFFPIGERPGYYEDTGEDAILMARYLTDVPEGQA